MTSRFITFIIYFKYCDKDMSLMLQSLDEQIDKNYKAIFVVDDNFKYQALETELHKTDIKYEFVYSNIRSESSLFNYLIKYRVKTEYFQIFNDQNFFEFDYVYRLKDALTKAEADIFVTSITRYKKNKVIKKSFRDIYTNRLKLLSEFLKFKKIRPYLPLYIFRTNLVKSNKVVFENNLVIGNDFSFISKCFYFSEKTVFDKNIFVSTIVNKSSRNRNSVDKHVLRTYFDVLYVFKLFIINKEGYKSQYLNLFRHPYCYFRLFRHFYRYDSMMVRLNYFYLIYAFFKDVFFLFLRHKLIYGNSYTPLLLENNLIDIYKDNPEKKAKFCLIYEVKNCFNNDYNKNFFTNLLNQDSKNYIVYLLIHENEVMAIDSSIKGFVYRYENVFNFKVYTNLSTAIKEIVQETDCKYYNISNTNIIPRVNLISRMNTVVEKNKHPDIVSASYIEYDYDKNLSKFHIFSPKPHFKNIVKKKFNKQGDIFLFNKFIRKEFLVRSLEYIEYSDTVYFMSNLLMMLKLYALSKKVSTYSRVGCYFQHKDENIKFTVNDLINLKKEFVSFYSFLNDKKMNNKQFLKNSLLSKRVIKMLKYHLSKYDIASFNLKEKEIVHKLIDNKVSIEEFKNIFVKKEII